uniref:Thioredoxin domain-containing protein n=1 Tax=Attheya septentrionalis TaxID=420275 RepID=A0A7S2UHW2_9STRA|mmetsp:Transcript_24345/g.44034  ORF Transcript_24345/g.44034 Transcript_24345/m.44034 type:complete len:483 (+) Transcript_24345:159-1607(+)|eukprot:CAMPEP_0198300956 /NCGR_PEP_ID=MMETSP1449-20131203/50062_1 /TAXON_ID=420275 /ORGANISM="Attheya septentrionalis, Strain CCMP2084" /LENGTH=482 /DNA_ID=CAMNT_0044002911 /DNA_START=121 /DNA_END=1569 /DNA_ORIENTATION=+
MNNINGSGGRGRQMLSSVDFYRRVPKDLTEATSLGAAMSICALAVMGVLFLSESIAFARSTITTSITLDENTQPQIRLNFNITMLDLHCDYVSVDVWDALGTNRQNVTKNVEKWQLDSEGTRRIFSGRNRETREVQHQEHDKSLKELHEEHGGAYAVDLTGDTFDEFLQDHEMAFIDLYAPWCVWCQRLHPTWEVFAREADDDEMPIGVGKVDCVAQQHLCSKLRVMAFPTLRWYHKGAPIAPDYKLDRTVAALKGFAKRKLEMDEKFKDWESKDKDNSEKRERPIRGLAEMNRPEHPGCQVSGHLMVNRVPGNFHIEAVSKNHNLNAAMTNLTHRVNHLSFGEPMETQNRKTKRILKQVPEEHRQFNPMDGGFFRTDEFHQAFHHYIKVVSTHLSMGGGSKTNTMTAYQFLEQSQIVYYESVNVPEARFSYDLSPMSVVVQKEGRKWYDYLTSLCAIIGGTFTTLGLIDACLYKVFKSKKL